MERKHLMRTSDGAQLAYWLWRSEAEPAPLLVLLHGAASNHSRWSEFIATTRLKHSWDLLRPDMRGHGESAFRGRLDLRIWCRDLVELLDAAGYAKAVLVGHSLGAHIAINFAAQHPERTSALALIDPVFPCALTGSTRRMARLRPLITLAVRVLRLLNAMGLRRRRIPAQNLRLLDEETRSALLESGNKKEIAKKYGSLRLILRHNPTANYFQQMIAMIEPFPPLEAIRAPSLVLLSAGVNFADPALNRAQIGRFPSAEIVPIEADHWPLTERPDDIRLGIEEWVEKLPHRRRTAAS